MPRYEETCAKPVGWALSSPLRSAGTCRRAYNSFSFERSRFRNASKSSDRHRVTRLTTDFETPVPLSTSANVASMSRVDIPWTSISSEFLGSRRRRDLCHLLCFSYLRHLHRYEDPMRSPFSFVLRVLLVSTQRLRHLALILHL